MGAAHTRAQQRWGLAPSQPPKRPADIELQAWLDDKGYVDWTYISWPQGACSDLTHNDRVLALFDATWVVADDRSAEGGVKPAVWMALDQKGVLTWFTHGDLKTGTSLTHALWLVRAWWRVTKRWALLVWRAGRGKG